MSHIKTALSLVSFGFLAWGVPFIMIGLCLHLTPSMKLLPQRVAGFGIIAVFGFMITYIMTQALGIIPIFRRGAELHQKYLFNVHKSQKLKSLLFGKIESHRVYLLFLITLFPLTAVSPNIFHWVWTFLSKGFTDNAFVGVIAALIVLALIAVIGLFYGLIIYSALFKREWDVWDPVNMGFLYYSFVGITYGVSLGWSIFDERTTAYSWKWWLQLWMGLEFALYSTRFGLMMAIDKASPGALDQTMEESILPSTRAWYWGSILLISAGLVFLWQQSEGISHAVAAALMFAFYIDRLWSLFRHLTTGKPAPTIAQSNRELCSPAESPQ